MKTFVIYAVHSPLFFGKIDEIKGLLLRAAILVSKVLRGRAFAGIGDYSDGKGGRGVVGEG